jgi:metal-responsive CopG/Arc/MetJ family transcriptional regulator
MVVRKQALVQLSDELLAALDQRASQLGVSRSALIRRAVEAFLADAVEAEIDRRIQEGYKARPPEELWGDLPARAMVAAEPW